MENVIGWLEGKKTVLVGVLSAVAGVGQGLGWWDVTPAWLSPEEVMALMGGVMVILRYFTKTPILKKN